MILKDIWLKRNCKEQGSFTGEKNLNKFNGVLKMCNILVAFIYFHDLIGSIKIVIHETLKVNN